MELHSGSNLSKSTRGTLYGYWDYHDSGIDTASSFCYPDRLLFLAYYDPEKPRLITYNQYYTRHQNCSANITNKALYLHGSNLTTISLVDDIKSPTIKILFTPSRASTTLILIPHTNSTYKLTFARPSDFTVIQGDWKRDWQSNRRSLTHYSLQIISLDNIKYMQSSYLDGCILITEFVVEVSPGNYYDAYLNETFIYDQPTNTLRTQTGLYSNGSLFDTVPFARLWGFPQAITSCESCCLPKYVNITHNEKKTNLAYGLGGTHVMTEQSNILNVVYVLPDGYLTNPRCQELNTEIQDGFIETTMSVIRPDIIQLIWTDKLNNTISFADPTTLSQILVNFPNQCSFIMIPLSNPVRLPKWVSDAQYF